MSIPLVLAGDVGGTRTRLGLFEPRATRPRPLAMREFQTLDFPGLDAIISTFLDANPSATVRSACFGVAGPVTNNAATLTNVPWRVDGDRLAQALGVARVAILNDLQAMAYSVPVLEPAELHTIQPGIASPHGNMALVAAGTGLGEALLHNIQSVEGAGARTFLPSASESGHADFAARTDREIALLQDLTHRFGRASVERVVSGPGLVNIHRVTHSAPCRSMDSPEDADAPAKISKAALEHRCQGCVAALDMFVEAYGAEAGNLALRTLATGGLFIGGGIARRILPAIGDGRFLRAFTSKAPFDALLQRIPVHVILDDAVGLLGAAAYASRAASPLTP